MFMGIAFSLRLNGDYFRLPRCILRLAMIHTPLCRGDTGFTGPVVSAHIGVALVFPFQNNRQKNKLYAQKTSHISVVFERFSVFFVEFSEIMLRNILARLAINSSIFFSMLGFILARPSFHSVTVHRETPTLRAKSPCH